MLILRIPLNFSSDTGHKLNRFLKTLLKKELEFVSSKRDKTVTFNWSFLLLLAEIDLILKKQGYKKDALDVCDTSRVKIIFPLLTKVVVLHTRITIVYVRIFSLKSSIWYMNLALLCFWPLTNNFGANLMALCRYTLVYIFGRLWTKVKV